MKTTRIATETQARQLADLLNGDRRVRPVVVVTTPSGRSNPWIDVASIEEEVGDVADLYVVSTGPHNKMPAMTQVYGGAGRVYPVGHEWASRPSASPLRFAFDANGGARTTRTLIDDALGMAADAGLFSERASSTRSRREGVVQAIVADRAMVKLDHDWGNVSPQLVLPGVPMDRLLSPGMRLNGWYDSASHWYDVREQLRAPDQALDEYVIGDLVLALVGEVEAERAQVFPHPLVHVGVERAHVTSNELDDLRHLMTSGEVLAARVVSKGPRWELSLLDVDDDEVPRPAVALIEGGPPWLMPPTYDPIDFVSPDDPLLPVLIAEDAPLALPQIEDAETSALLAEDVETTRPRPTPVMFDRTRSSPKPGVPTANEAASPTGAVATMRLTIDKLKAELKRALQSIGDLSTQLQGLSEERRLIAYVNETTQSKLNHLETQLLHLRAQLRKAKQSKTGQAAGGAPEFADREEGFRYAVLTAWARRTPVGEQLSNPLPEYLIGPDFLDSVDALAGVARERSPTSCSRWSPDEPPRARAGMSTSSAKGSRAIPRT